MESVGNKAELGVICWKFQFRLRPKESRNHVNRLEFPNSVLGLGSLALGYF